MYLIKLYLADRNTPRTKEIDKSRAVKEFKNEVRKLDPCEDAELIYKGSTGIEEQLANSQDYLFNLFNGRAYKIKID